MSGFDKLIGRYSPYGEYPYLIQQNAKIRQMNSLVQRNAGNLYKQIADPYGQNPFGEFGTDIQGFEIQPETQTATSILRSIPGTTAQDTTAQGTTAQGTTAQDTIAQETAAQGTTAQETKEPTFKYNRVDIPFCKYYINTPWYNWTFSSTQQTALNFLQARGDELLINYFSEENKYPPLASLFLLPNTNPKFTKYNYSDRQMVYLYYNRNPDQFRFICPTYDLYVINWCRLFNNFKETCKDHGVDFTESEIYALVRGDVMSKPTYERYAIGGNEEVSQGGYLNWRLVQEYKNNRSAAMAKVQAVQSKGVGVYIAGTVDTFLVSDGPRPEPQVIDSLYQSSSGQIIQAPGF